ncbi:MAG: TonB-dependent receptor [Alistipes sp.]|nr:TonB-dependent receptor [Alistipes sp.]
MNLRTALTLLFATLAMHFAVAQGRGSVSGRVVDGDTLDGVAGAVVEIAPARTPDAKRYFTTEYGGYFTIPNVTAGEYSCTVTFVGYADKTITFTTAGLPKNIGDIQIVASAIGIETVVKTAVSTRTVIMGDTLRYNADSFKVAVDAEVEALLRKMPGITISDGKVEAHGEEVKQIYVDGNEFFGGNVAQVLQSIPAQAVEHIEVYNRLSEAAQITGVDDGEGSKVINIITRRSINRSRFGKVHIGYGYEPDADPAIAMKHKYTAGGSVNLFNDDCRLTVTGLVNNLNKQNLSEDEMSIRSSANRNTGSRQFSVNNQSGVASAEIFALNYSDRWGRRRRAKFEGSIFYNHLNAKNQYTIDRWYDPAVSKKDTVHYDQFSNPNNHTLRFRGRLDWKVAKRQKLVLIPSVSYTPNSSINRVDTTSLRWGESGYRWMPSGNEGWSRGRSHSLYAQYSYRFMRQGRSLLMVASVSNSVSDSDRDYYSNGAGKTNKKDPNLATIAYTYNRKVNENHTTTYRLQPTFRERLGRHSTLNISYRLQAQMRTRDLFSYATDADYVIDTARINRRSSSSFEGSFVYHQAGVGYRYGRNRNWFSISAMYQHSRLKNHNVWTGERVVRTYNHPVYNATLQWAFNAQNTLRVSATSEVKAPSLWQMIDVYDVSNSQYLTRGNPNLKPYTEHNYFVRYTNLSSRHGTTFMVMAKATLMPDYIGTSIVYSPPAIEVDGKKYNPVQLSQPVNLSGYRSFEGRTSIGFPINPISSNLNVELGATYSDVPISLNEVEQLMNNFTAYTNLTLGSNISENVDFTLRWRGSYSNNRAGEDVLNNEFFTHRATANMKFVLPLGFTITTSGVFTQYLGITNDYRDSFILWNASIGKKVLRKLGEIEFCVNDILNQNTSFARGVWAGYSQVRYNSTMGRYFLLKFTYNIRSFPSGNTLRPSKSLTTNSSVVPKSFFERMERHLNSLF